MCDIHMHKKIITIAMMKIYFTVYEVSIYGMQWIEKLVKECEHEK